MLLERRSQLYLTTIHPDPIASSHHFPSVFSAEKVQCKNAAQALPPPPGKTSPAAVPSQSCHPNTSTQEARDGKPPGKQPGGKGKSSSFQANTCAARPVYQARINNFRLELDEQSIIACTLESDSVVQMPIDTLNDIVHNEFPLGTRFPFPRLTWHLKI